MLFSVIENYTMDYCYDLWIITILIYQIDIFECLQVKVVIIAAEAIHQTFLANHIDMNKYMDIWIDRYIC